MLGLGVLVTFSDSGHAATTSPSWLSLVADVLHIGAMAVWLGGLLMLVGALLPRRDDDELRAVLPVFSRAAFTSVVVLAVTGTYAAWRGIGTIHAIFTTSYGLLVDAKIVLFVAILAVANLSRKLVRRRTVAYAMTATAAAAPVEELDGRRRAGRAAAPCRVRRGGHRRGGAGADRGAGGAAARQGVARRQLPRPDHEERAAGRWPARHGDRRPGRARARRPDA